MSLKNKLTLLFVLTIFLSACFSEKKYVEVQKINEVSNFSEEGIIYTLPKTTIIVEVELSKTSYIKGPFSEYTEQFLGTIENIIKENSTHWEISDINFYSYPEADTNNVYVIKSNEGSCLNCVNLSEEGFLLSINSDVDWEHNDFSDQQKDFQSTTGNTDVNYGEISIDKNYKEVYDTVYHTQQTDTAIIKIPVIKKNIVKKSKKEQAEELAEEILILRDDRKALLVGEGDSDYLPDGEAIKFMVKKIEELEQQYLAMFVGKTRTEKFKYKFKISPEKSDINSQIELFRFSAGLGILTWSNSVGEPIMLEMQVANNAEPIKNYNSRKKLAQKELKKKNADGVFYRIPEKTTISVKRDNKVLYKSDIYVAQFGEVANLPLKLFNGESSYSIEFHQELGSIKKIKKQ